MFVRTIQVLFLINVVFFVNAARASVENTPEPYYYTIAPITQMTPGNFGNLRLYYSKACNQDFLEVLTEAVDDKSFNVGVLTKVYPSGCNRPPQSVYTTVRSRGAQVNAVTKFAEVWRCDATCVIFANGRPQPFSLFAFGTSYDQAVEQMTCSGAMSNLACREIEIR